jgi:hypothetical protein
MCASEDGSRYIPTQLLATLSTRETEQKWAFGDIKQWNTPQLLAALNTWETEQKVGRKNIINLMPAC